MNLDEAQRKRVAAWVAEGLKLSDIQNRIMSELGLRMTYMEVRLLVDDLKLTPKDLDRPKAGASSLDVAGAGPAPGTAGSLTPASSRSAPPAESRAGSKGVLVSVDQIARPGTVVSGKVTFSDSNQAEWYFDDAGRLGLVPQQPGYRPPAADLQQFQAALETELKKMGY